jgi:UDP-N-acetylmuramate--alanine ligase
LDIYPAREEPIPGVSSDMIFERIDLKDKWRSTKDDLIHDLKDKVEPIILTIGAGDIGTLVGPIKKLIEKIDE